MIAGNAVFAWYSLSNVWTSFEGYNSLGIIRSMANIWVAYVRSWLSSSFSKTFLNAYQHAQTAFSRTKSGLKKMPKKSRKNNTNKMQILWEGVYASSFFSCEQQLIGDIFLAPPDRLDTRRYWHLLVLHKYPWSEPPHQHPSQKTEAGCRGLPGRWLIQLWWCYTS